MKIKYAPCHAFPSFTFGSLCSLATISVPFWPLSQLGPHYLQKKIHIFPYHKAGMNQQPLCTKHHKQWAPYFSAQIGHQAGNCWILATNKHCLTARQPQASVCRSELLREIHIELHKITISLEPGFFHCPPKVGSIKNKSRQDN